MRVLKAILTIIGAAVAVVLGLLVAAALAVIGAVFSRTRRLHRRGNPPFNPSGSQRTRPGNAGDVIDVTATEVRPEPPGR